MKKPRQLTIEPSRFRSFSVLQTKSPKNGDYDYFLINRDSPVISAGFSIVLCRCAVVVFVPHHVFCLSGFTRVRQVFQPVEFTGLDDSVAVDRTEIVAH